MPLLLDMSKYIPKTPIENNSIEEKPIALLKSIIGFIVIIIVAIVGLYEIFNVFISKISLDTEQKIFSSGNINDNYNVDSTLTLKYTPLFDSLVYLSSLNGYKLNFYVVDDSVINAFALPGGTIVVFKPLIDLLNDSDALAFVIGHELGHIAHRDVLKGLSAKLSINIVMTILGSSGSTDRVLSAMMDQAKLNFSKNQETLADEYGTKLLYELRGYGDGAIYALKKLAKISDEGKLIYLFASDHPDPEFRINNIERYVDKLENRFNYKDL